jgi:DNA invertase Pin-like site-specific DNA recombinase
VDVYIRVSETGDRTAEESTELYEAQCREWADRHGVTIDLLVEDTDVSGATAVAERGLEELIKRVEVGESPGIITPRLNRFGRDVIEGAVALKRVVDAGGKLVGALDGFDSSSPESDLIFNLQMSIAQAERARNRGSRITASERAADRGVYLAAKPPFGYERDDDKRLVPKFPEAEIVKELFHRKATTTDNNGEILRWFVARCEGEGCLSVKTKSGLRQILKNRAYLGEATTQTAKKGSPRIIKNSHDPLLTPDEFNAAQGTQPFVPRTGLALTAELRGLVFCDGCGRRLKVLGYSTKAGRVANYACTSKGCPERAAMKAEILDDYVGTRRLEAAMNREPHIVAVMEGDHRYEDALAEVRRAEDDLDTYRDSVEIQRAEGPVGFAKGIESRKAAIKVARDRMAELKPVTVKSPNPGGAATKAQLEAMLEAEANARFIDRVVVSQAEKQPGGRWVDPSPRVAIYWKGAEEPV